MNGCVESISKCKVRPFCRFTIYEQRVEPPFLRVSACKKGVRNTKTHAEPQRQGGETYTRRSAPNLPFSAPLRAKKQPEPPRSTQSRKDKETKHIRGDLPAPSFSPRHCVQRNSHAPPAKPQKRKPCSTAGATDSQPSARLHAADANLPRCKREAITPQTRALHTVNARR